MAEDRRTPREEELLAAAATGDLDAAERAELDALVAADPTLGEELAALGVVSDRVGELAGWDDALPPAALHRSVLAVPDGELPHVSRSRAPVLLVAASIIAALGVGAGLGVALTPSAPQSEEAAPTGPPGTLGAVEEIDFRGEPRGVEIDAALVAHTWGTETVLEMDGFAVGDRYRVVLVDRRGRAEDSGTFLGSTVRVECRLNAALLREDVEAVEIRDGDGAVVATSQVPDVAAG